MSDALPLGPWIAPPADLRPPLAGDVRADVAIVGAGYTGLSAALALRRAGVDVVVLEREFAGYGASGRNAGHLTSTIGKDLPTLQRFFGRERAARLVRFAEEAVRCAEGLMREHAITCDYHPTGNVMAAVHPAQERRLRTAAAAAAQLGARVRFLDGEAMRARGLPPAFIAGALEECGGTLDPGRYVLGLRRAALAAGVRLHEQTAVQTVADGPPPRLHTARGTVTAERVLLATNAYTPALGRLRHAIYPLHDTLFETEPLDAAQRAALAWPDREGIYTAHESLESYRLTARGTIVGGSKGVRYPYGGALTGGSSPATVAWNAQAFRDRFPQLADVRIAHHWGGWIAMTLHFLPTVGASGTGGRILHAVGYNGHGIAVASAMGAVLADLALGRANEHAADFAGFVPPLPPEPLRWMLVRAGLGLVNALDRRVDRQLRRGSAG